jgi:hypothetical protein
VQQQPLVLTLELDPVSFQFFDALRKAHFPRERNFLAAHLTLFHHLPPGEQAIQQDLVEIAAATPTIDIAVTAVVSIGKGVAYKMESEPLQQLHKKLQQRWKTALIPQDRQTLWPHVTVQNKVTPAQATALQQELANSFTPFKARGTALRLWIYQGGPWEALQSFQLANGVERSLG